MAATFVQANAGTGVASGKVATAQYGVNVTAGNLLVACVACRVPTGSVAVVSVTDDVGNRWKQAAEGCTIGALFADADQRGVDVWYCDQATGGNRPRVTATWQGFPDSGVNNGMRVLVLEYGGGAGGYECVETIGVGEVDGTTGTVTTIDNCSANDLLVSIVGNNASANTVPAGWNSRVNDTTYGMAVADLLDSGAGGATKSAAWTGMTSNTKGYGLVVAFKLGGSARRTRSAACGPSGASKSCSPRILVCSMPYRPTFGHRQRATHCSPTCRRMAAAKW